MSLPKVAAAPAAHSHLAAADIAAFADTFTRLTRSSVRTRQQFLAAAKHNVEWSASVIIACVVHEGPLRASALAEAVQSDPSTISRQVATLVKDGLLERRADPVDGRASLLVITPKGEEAYRAQVDMRNEHFAEMLGGWGERDLRRFTALLRRFTDDYEKYRPRLFDERDAQTEGEAR
jgi:DNA-binding MarR family transcriptional regulator